MRLELISWTPHAEEICAAAAFLCYHPVSIDQLTAVTPEKVGPLLSKVISSGHHSVVEHVSFTFAVEGVSRACTHQLVRHRIASYSQQSQRHVPVGETEFVIPPKILANPDLKKAFKESLNQSFEAYRKLIYSGVPIEDARYLLPQASKSRLIFTMNARELWHFFELRCCEKAQWEIRTLAFLALKKVKEIAPNLFQKAGPKCFHGSCSEEDFPCWRFGSAFFRKKKDQFIDILSKVTPLYEEIKMPEFTLNPWKIVKELECSSSQLLQAEIGELSGEPMVILASDPSRLLKKLESGFGLTPALWDKEKVLKKTSYSFMAVPIIPFRDKVSYFIEEECIKQNFLYTNLASPWWYAKIPGKALLNFNKFAKEVRVL